MRPDHRPERTAHDPVDAGQVGLKTSVHASSVIRTTARRGRCRRTRPRPPRCRAPLRRRQTLFDLFGRTHVTVHGQKSTFGWSRRVVGDGHLVALLFEPASARKADAAGTTGDQDHLLVRAAAAQVACSTDRTSDWLGTVLRRVAHATTPRVVLLLRVLRDER